MGRSDNSLDGEAWQVFKQKYREGSLVNGRVSGVRNYGVFVSITVEDKRNLEVSGLMPKSALPPRSDVTHMYVPGQKVHARITRVKQDHRGKRGLIDLEPTWTEWWSFLERYRRGAIVGGKVKIIDAACHRVYVLLHEIELVGVIRRDEMFPCCQKDISHFMLEQELKLGVEQIVSYGGQWEIRLKMQRMRHTECALAFSVGSELDGTVHAQDGGGLQILLNEGLIGTVPGVVGAASPRIGTKVRVGIEEIRPMERMVRLSLLDPSPRFGRVYWAEDNGLFSDKPYRPVVMAPRGREVGAINAIFLSTKGGPIPCPIEEVCFLTENSHIVLLNKRYPLNRLQHYQQCYWGELPQIYQQKIQHRLGLNKGRKNG